MYAEGSFNSNTDPGSFRVAKSERSGVDKLLGLTSGQDVSPPRQDRAWSQGTFGSPHLVLLAPLAWESLGTTASSIRLQTPEVLASRPAPP